MVRFRLLAGITTLSLCRIGSDSSLRYNGGTEDDFRLVVALLQRVAGLKVISPIRVPTEMLLLAGSVGGTALRTTCWSRSRWVRTHCTGPVFGFTQSILDSLITQILPWLSSTMLLYDAFVNIDGMEVFHLQGCLAGAILLTISLHQHRPVARYTSCRWCAPMILFISFAARLVVSSR